MKFLTLLLFPVLAVAAPTPDATPSNAALRATVVHMQQLTHDLQSNLEKEKAGHKQADTSLESTSSTLAAATAQLVTLQKQVNTQTEKLNATQDKLEATAKKLWWYRVHWWGSWIALGLGILAWVIVLALKATGKLAVVGAAVASKIP